MREDRGHEVGDCAHLRVALLDLRAPVGLRAHPAGGVEEDGPDAALRVLLVRSDAVTVLARRVGRDDDELRRVEDEDPVAGDDGLDRVAHRARVGLRPGGRVETAALEVQFRELADARALGLLVRDAEEVVA